MLNSHSFRAYENAFSLITQVVGRGGRADSPGHAVIQTTDPGNPVLRLAARQDYDAFFEQEIGFRRLGLYPPFCSLCVAGFTGKKEGEVVAAAARFGKLLAEEAGKTTPMPLRILGPAPMNIVMVNELYRYKLTIKCRNDKAFRDLMRATMDRYSQEGLPAKASLALSSETIFTMLAGMIFFQEIMSAKEYLGCALIFIAIIASQLEPKKKSIEKEYR
jgi:primosomal protein N' (replication factor Y)